LSRGEVDGLVLLRELRMSHTSCGVRGRFEFAARPAPFGGREDDPPDGGRIAEVGRE
jgi:hypothetical protein